MFGRVRGLPLCSKEDDVSAERRLLVELLLCNEVFQIFHKYVREAWMRRE